MKWIIDCDTGMDDAQAIMLMAAANKFLASDNQIIAITCCGGNSPLDQIVKNTQVVLKYCDLTDVPVYLGATMPLIRCERDKVQRAAHYHGDDGLGNYFVNREEVSVPENQVVKGKSATEGLIELSKKYSEEGLSILAIAPLTNLAQAQRVDPQFLGRFKEVVIMGGAYQGKGNMFHQLTAEFNFGHDPEAAKIVINECPTRPLLVPWETCFDFGMEWEWSDNQWSATAATSNTPACGLLHHLYCRQKSSQQATNYHPRFRSCDLLAACVAVCPEQVVSELLVRRGDVELAGEFTRGQLVLDWYNKHSDYGQELRIVVATNCAAQKDLMMAMTKL